MHSVRWAPVLLVAGFSSAAMAEGGGAQALITPHIGTFFWTLLTFFVMLFILRKFAWGPLLGALNDREASIRDSVDKARSDRGRSRRRTVVPGRDGRRGRPEAATTVGQKG